MAENQGDDRDVSKTFLACASDQGNDEIISRARSRMRRRPTLNGN
jgi:hypothetical protein